MQIRENLSKKEYWDNIHKDKSIITQKKIKLPGIKTIIIGFHNRELYKICKKHISKKYKKIFEVWCAPGNHLIKFHKIFWLHPNWIEYSKSGIKILEQNFKKNDIQWNIIHWNFFDKKFIKSNINKYDIVYSVWFIEHFSNPKIAVENHFKIAKKWWLIIITIPNFHYINKYFKTQKVLDIHNLEIMEFWTFKRLFQKYEILELRYFWWLFNIWLFSYENIILEKIRFILFVLQRIFIDPLFIILYKLWINLNNKYTSPSIIAICKK